MTVEMFSGPSLHERMCRTWGSNSGPLACQANSLPIELPCPVSYDRKDSSNLIVSVVINSYSCFLLDNIVRSMQHQLQIACTYILINIERVSKHTVIILGLRVVTSCWSWACTNRTSPSNGVGLGSPLATCSVYGDLTCSVHTVNNLCLFSCQWFAYLCNWRPYVRLAYMSNLLSPWNKVIIIIILLEYNTFYIPLVADER